MAYSDMAKKYRIGKFSFDTREEYNLGMTDVKNIYKITHSVDIYDPNIALSLYQAIRTGKIELHSRIGTRFFLDLADIVAKNAEISEEEKERQREELRSEQRKYIQTDISRRILGAVCLAAAFVCIIWYFWLDYTNQRGNETNDYLKTLRDGAQETAGLVSNDVFFNENAPELAMLTDGSLGYWGNGYVPEILPEYKAIVQENQDFGGWLTIEGTVIDYPVMYSRTDPEFYLKHNFNKEEDINGTLFIDARVNLASPGTNIIIYGHNMRSGQMFGGLKRYLEEDYFQSHKQITFDTIYEKGNYEIFAVCLAQVRYQDEDAYRYYNFLQADSEEAFDEFLQNVLELSVFVDQELPEYGDELLTLSTCNSYVEDGRLFLVAKKSRDAE